MIKVHCESCNAPYQVDEKRIPKTGMKMRCPKCGHSFQVLAPNADGATAAADPAAATAPNTHAAGADLPGVRAPRPAAPRAVAVAAKPVAPAAAASPAAAAAVSEPFEIDLPGLAPARPAAAKPAPGFGELAPDFGMADLPARAQPAAPARPVLRATAHGVGPALKPTATTAGGFGAVDLPGLNPPGADDLPALPSAAARPAIAKRAAAPAPAAPAAPFSGFGDIELPAADDAPGLPSARSAGRTAGGFGEVELPALRPAARPALRATGVAAAGAAAAPKAAPPASIPGFGDLDLPALSTGVGLPALGGVGLPALGGVGLPALGSVGLPALGGVGLPALGGAGLPVLSSTGLPAVSGTGLPVLSSTGLPVVSSTGLPVVSNTGLPALGGDFGQPGGLPTLSNQMPEVANQLPALSNQMPLVAGSFEAVGLPPMRDQSTSGSFDFGAFDLPMSERPGAGGSAGSAQAGAIAMDFSFDMPPRGAAGQDAMRAPTDSSLFGEFDLPGQDPMGAPASNRDVGGAGNFGNQGGGAAGYGEVDLGGGDAGAGFAGAGFELDGSAAGGFAGSPSGGLVGAINGPLEVALPEQKAAPRQREVLERKPMSRIAKVAIGAFSLSVIGGGALEFTTLGAFGRHPIADAVSAGGWDKRALAMASEGQPILVQDTFVPLRKLADEYAAEHERTPRAKAITARAAFLEYMTQLRFGVDAGRGARADGWLKDVPKDGPVVGSKLAYAAKAAKEGDFAAARLLARAAGNGLDAQLLRGEIELRANSAPAALAEFRSALAAGGGAAANFGIARAQARAGDPDAAAKAAEETLKTSPNHPGARILRADLAWPRGKIEEAREDLKAVLEGASAGSASAREQSAAYAVRGAILFDGARPGEARVAFTEAIKLDPQNVDALVGEADVSYTDARYTEALGRFEAAIAVAPTNVLAIVGIAKTRIQLERLQEAKAALTKAREAQPKSMLLTLWVGKVEDALGNRSGAEKEFQQALALVDPKSPTSIEAYVASATFLAARGRADEAAAKLAEAKSKLAPSWQLDRAFGDVAIVQGKFDDAVGHFKSALTRRPTDLALRFRLGAAYRRMNKLELARTELEQIATADRNFPGLAFERGLLFEQAGEVDKALAEFKGALEKAPKDVDLKLRVGAAYVMVNRPDEALPLLEDVLRERGGSAEANHYMGRARLEQGPTQMINAMRFLKRAVELDPNRAEFHLYVAWAANDSNPRQLGLARDEVEKALALDKLSADAYWQRGVVRRYEKAVNDALVDLNHALELKPTRFEAYATIAECYQDMNQPEKALEAWQRAIAANERVARWRLNYAKLLLDRHRAADALPHLEFAVAEMEKDSQRPGDLHIAEFLLATTLQKQGRAKDSIRHFQSYLQFAPTSDPDRLDARTALAAMKAPEKPE